MGLVVFVGGVAVGHDARTRLHMTHISLHDDGADGDAGVHSAVIADVARCARIGPAAHTLQLLDDLHGPDFGRAADRARREGGGQQIERVQVIVELAHHVADDVHDMAEALHGHHHGRLDRAEFAYPAQIIAGQIHQHDVLGPLFGISQQIFGQTGVLLGRTSPPSCARNGVNLSNAVFQTHVHLRAGADEPQVAGQIQEEHVGAGVGHAQGPIDGEGIGLGALAQALAEHDLEDIAGDDVFLGPSHHGLVCILTFIGDPTFAIADVREVGRGKGLGQLGHDALDAGHSVGIRGGDVPFQPGVGQDNKTMLHMVEDDQIIGHEEDRVGEMEIVCGGGGQAFEMADDVVTPIAHRTAGE